MLTRETIVKNSVGLSARPATDFVLKANTYHCSFLALKIMKNRTVCIVAGGPDEEIALQELSAMLEKEDA